MNKRLKTIFSNDLKTGSCLYALQDSSKHIWKPGSLIEIKSMLIIILFNLN
jgi:hypothetical protein